MSQPKLTEAEVTAPVAAENDTVPPVSGPRRRSTQPMFAPPSVRAERTSTQTGLSAPPMPLTATERVLRAVGLTRRPVRAPR